MGKFDSSITRVRPIFRKLRERDIDSWLPDLVRLPICGNEISLPAECDFGISEFFPNGNGEERKLSAPVALLSWLIRHPQELARSKGACDSALLEERRELLSGSYGRMMEALSLLQDNHGGEKWHIFEGETQPDVFIATPSLMVVIEGKRTETGPTTETKWMTRRHQMLRHLDCAWEIRGKRRVVGFFIVEAESGGEEVPLKWQEFAKNTISAEVIASSLPHRGPAEQNQIASCFAGVTTWERVCGRFGIDASMLPHSV